MFRAFNLSGLTSDVFARWRETGLAIAGEQQETVTTSLASFATSNGALAGRSGRQSWFPQIDADVFIAHSRCDTLIAADLAGWLSDIFGLTPFIDSSIWGNADELLMHIDNECRPNRRRESISQEKRHDASSNVHMMFATALGMMIDHCECVIFLNTPRLIFQGEPVDTAQSPWVYFEVAMARMARKRQPKRILQPREFVEQDAHSGPQYVSSLDFSPFTSVDVQTLHDWQRQFYPTRHRALDVLYSLTPQQREPAPRPTARTPSRDLFRRLIRG